MTTVKEYRHAVRHVAKRVFCVPRFGVSDRLVRISKSDALWLVDGYPPETKADDLEMYAGTFAHWDKDDLIVG